MGKTMKVYRRPGKPQIGFVFLVCVLLLVAAVTVGIMLLMGKPIGFDLTWMEEELREYFR